MAANYKVKYTQNLRTESIHLNSGTQLITDAPIDNNGKGEKFSPTDLVASALASCILTIWGINLSTRDKELKEVTCDVEKVMASNPRRIATIILNFDFGLNEFSKEEFKRLHHLADSCPVANSLSKDISIETNLKSFY